MTKVRQRGLAASVCAVSILISTTSWAQDEKAVEACHERQSTSDIVSCLDKLRAQ
jgi:hypothetical protein